MIKWDYNKEFDCYVGIDHDICFVNQIDIFPWNGHSTGYKCEIGIVNHKIDVDLDCKLRCHDGDIDQLKIDAEKWLHKLIGMLKDE